MDIIKHEDEGQLIAAVRSLNAAIVDLKDMIAKDYPKRDEIERDFVTKYNIKKRTKQLVVITILAIVFSYMFTMGTVSYCFLQGQGSVNQTRQVCYILPGYGNVIQYQRDRLQQYDQLVQRSLDNEQRLEVLEGK